MRTVFRPSERATATILACACLIALWFAGLPSTGATWAYNQENLIRLHVVANSDSEVDQQVKLTVRDAINAYLAPLLVKADGIPAARAIVQAQLPAVKAVADAALREGGAAYASTAEFGRCAFPTRTYANLVVPAGDYDALRVVLGAGSGRNWWCVIFPPLCLVDISTASPEDAPALTTGEADLLAREDPANLTPVLRSKLVELIRQAPVRFHRLAQWLSSAIGRR